MKPIAFVLVLLFGAAAFAQDAPLAEPPSVAPPVDENGIQSQHRTDLATESPPESAAEVEARYKRLLLKANHEASNTREELRRAKAMVAAYKKFLDETGQRADFNKWHKGSPGAKAAVQADATRRTAVPWTFTYRMGVKDPVTYVTKWVATSEGSTVRGTDRTTVEGLQP